MKFIPKQTETKFAIDVDINDFRYLHPALMHMVGWTIHWCFQNGVTPYFTSLHRPKNDGISKSDTHQTYRAADLSLLSAFGWCVDKVDNYHLEFFKEFENVGALVHGKDGLEPRPIYIHGVGTAYHAHLQVRY